MTQTGLLQFAEQYKHAMFFPSLHRSVTIDSAAGPTEAPMRGNYPLGTTYRDQRVAGSTILANPANFMRGGRN